jgi:hypothetical protein
MHNPGLLRIFFMVVIRLIYNYFQVSTYKDIFYLQVNK